MNLRDLEYVLAVERHGSITRAAEACDVTQPTLSAQIAKLEAELGVRIFERDGRRLKITAAGRTVLDHANEIVRAVADLIMATQGHRDPLAGPFRLGLIPTLAPYLLPSLLPAARARLPRVALSVVEDQTGSLIERLRAGTLDAAMLATAIDDDHLAATPLFDEPLWLALPAQHPLAARGSIRAAEIDASTLLLLSEGHCLRDQALALCKDPTLGAKAPGDFRAASLETILNLVEAGHGLTLVPELALKSARRHDAGLAVRPFVDAGAHRRISLVHRRSTPRRLLLAELANITKAVWQEHRSGRRSRDAF
jgi:LysR family hydrogen peroxide-inducible transcriptional activator